MIKRFLYKILLLSYLILYTSSAKAELVSQTANGIIYVKQTTVEEIEDLFNTHRYRRFRYLENNDYPAIFLKSLPSDFTSIQSQKHRNELFIRILAPLALKVNEEISNERHQFLRIERHYRTNKKLTKEELKILEELAVKYDYFTREKGDTRIALQLDNLNLRINIIPPSILIAIAAMETNWGSTRVANVANSLYKERIWFTNEGLEPLENKEDGYRFKIFDSLIESMRSYALTFNSSINYREIWMSRYQASLRNDNIIGESIAYSLAHASNLKNYSGILDYTTTFYNLYSIDIGHLKRLKD